MPGERGRLPGMTSNFLRELRHSNAARELERDPNGLCTPSFRGLELGNEVGEAMGVIKKLERARLGIKGGSVETVEHLAEEIADCLICLDLCAMTFDIDIEAAVRAKFNAISSRDGWKTRIDDDLRREPETERVFR
jgi:NTP pyrophosphatase (non-canonical NTP hydrolase)